MLHTYAVLIRGINVGGNSIVPMTSLRAFLEALGFSDVSTYIASGNVILKSAKPADQVKACIEKALPQQFPHVSELVKVLVLTHAQLRAIVDHKPKGFGEQPDTYHSDVIFLIGISLKEALAVFDPRQGVDVIWPGEGVVYSQRLSALRTKSRLGKIAGTPPYKFMTIRTWNTAVKLLALLEKAAAA